MPTVQFQPRPCPAAAKHHSHIKLLQRCVDTKWHSGRLSHCSLMKIQMYFLWGHYEPMLGVSLLYLMLAYITYIDIYISVLYILYVYTNNKRDSWGIVLHIASLRHNINYLVTPETCISQIKRFSYIFFSFYVKRYYYWEIYIFSQIIFSFVMYCSHCHFVLCYEFLNCTVSIPRWSAMWATLQKNFTCTFNL